MTDEKNVDEVPDAMPIKEAATPYSSVVMHLIEQAQNGVFDINEAAKSLATHSVRVELRNESDPSNMYLIFKGTYV
jgi:hypothetical protein